jgi:glutathione synthase/RimK-type ligase-like ATP-grasp enzyme
MKTIIVSDLLPDKVPAFKTLIDNLPHDVEVVPVTNYLMNELMEKRVLRVINLCQSYNYQSLGYYTSLLAEACKHKILPSVLSIQDLEKHTFESIISIELTQEIQRTFHHLHSEEFVVSVYFGKNIAKHYDSLCQKLFRLFPFPMFRVHFKHKKEWTINKIIALSLKDIPLSHYDFFSEAINLYLSKKRHYFPKKKPMHFNMAILHSAEEVEANNYTAPSNKKALKKFIDAAGELGIQAELIEKNDLKFLNEYDSLFIRETTSVNHYTYRFSRQAMAEGLVVVDDPISILKCANKIYLAELLKYHHISAPETIILSPYNYQEKMTQMRFPCVLKLPDSACSKGVKKANDPTELKNILKDFFKTSDLILAQNFMPSDFDWRIGIFDNIPLFACKYYMTKGHWQIYNWSEKSLKKQVGDTEAVPLNKVPKSVLETAMKGAKLIGNGLYGVDLKEIGNKAYIIEINDNPSIDNMCEDELLGDTLYTKIMQTFLQRMKKQHGYE